MRDEMDARIWVEHHAQFSEDLEKLFKKTLKAFERLTAIQFAAPWRRKARGL